MKTIKSRERRAFTLLESLVVTLVITILALMYLPYMLRPRHTGCRINCVNNLKQVGLGFRQWALDNNDKNPPQVSITGGGAMEWAELGSVYPIFSVMSNELNTPKVLICPEDKDRVSATIFGTSVPPGSNQVGFTNDAYVSYFVGLDAEETQPQMWLAGDSNLESYGKAIPHGLIYLRTNAPIRWGAGRHKHQGNVGLADGSVQGYSDTRMRASLVATAHATNRLVFPPPK